MQVEMTEHDHSSVLFSPIPISSENGDWRVAEDAGTGGLRVSFPLHTLL